MKLNKYTYTDISTKYISSEEMEVISDIDDNPTDYDLPITVYTIPFGWLICLIQDDIEEAKQQVKASEFISEQLKNIFIHCYENDIRCIRFDCDGDEYDDLINESEKFMQRHQKIEAV